MLSWEQQCLQTSLTLSLYLHLVMVRYKAITFQTSLQPLHGTLHGDLRVSSWAGEMDRDRWDYCDLLSSNMRFCGFGNGAILPLRNRFFFRMCCSFTGNSGMFRPEMLRPMGLPPGVRVIAWGLSLVSHSYLYLLLPFVIDFSFFYSPLLITLCPLSKSVQ